MFVQAENLNQAFILLSKALVEKGNDVVRRGHSCREISSAVLVEITNPLDRYIRIPKRKWNSTLGWIESLWIARGDSRLDMPVSYVKNLVNFSDDGKFMRAGYGPRIRRFGDNSSSINAFGGVMNHQYTDGTIGTNQSKTDQLRFVIEKFKQDISSREAVITIHDPVADNFDDSKKGDDNQSKLLETRDTPCTRSIHFMVVDGKMNCYVDIRSNDIIWGFSAVNVFNFTLMQEYVAAMVGVPVGSYFHKVDNLHVYHDFLPLVQQISEENILKYSSGCFFSYVPEYTCLEDFDFLIRKLSSFEELCRMRGEIDIYSIKEKITDDFGTGLFSDWAKIIFMYWNKIPMEFVNPMLNELFLLK